MGKTELYARLQRQTRETMLKAGKELEEEFRQRLLELEKEIVHQLIKQPKTEFEAWNLLQVWKSIEDSIGRWKKEAWLPTVEKHVKKTFREAEKHALKVLEELLGKEELQKKPPFNLLPEESLKFVLKFPFHFAGKFANDLKERIREKLFTGIAMGKSYWDIARKIDLLGIPTVKPFKNSWERAQTIARTEVARAYHMGTLMTYQRLGVEEIKIICGSSPCNLCLSHCGTIKPISYADYVLKHPNCTCTYVAAKWKGKVLEERDYKRAKELTEIKEYTLRKSKRFLEKFERIFAPPLTDEEIFERTKSLFKKEKDFWRHLFWHGIPNEVAISKFGIDNSDPTQKVGIPWHHIRDVLTEQEKVKYTKEFFIKILGALSHTSLVFYEEPYEGAEPDILFFSGWKGRRITVTTSGGKLRTSYQLKETLNNFVEKRKRASFKFVEVGIDEELRELIHRLHQIYKGYAGDT